LLYAARRSPPRTRSRPLHPSPSNPLGVKEPAKRNDRRHPDRGHRGPDAKPLGIDRLEMPYTPNRIWAAIEEKGQVQG
jgi:hypothetical protein